LPDRTRVIDAFSLSPTTLALAITNAAVAVLGMSLAGAFADRRLREKDAQLTTALNNMAQGLVMFDSQKRLIVHNSRYIEMYGLSPEIGKSGCTKKDLLRHQKEVGNFSEHVDQYCSMLDAAIAEGKTTSTMESTANGRTIHTVSRPMADGGWVTTHEDVTDRISAQRERDRNRDLLNLIVENVPVTIFVKKASDRRFILVNRACENTWGVPRTEILGKTASDIFPQSSADEINDGDEQLLKGSDPLYFNEHAIEMPRRGVRFVTAKRFVVRSTDYANQYLVGVVEDVAERKLSEERLRQAQKMETIGNLTGGLVHDFNKLLTARGRLPYAASAGHAGATANLKLTLHLDHSAGADQAQACRRGGKAPAICENPVYVRLHSKRHLSSWPSRSRYYSAAKAISESGSRPHGSLGAEQPAHTFIEAAARGGLTDFSATALRRRMHRHCDKTAVASISNRAS